MIYVTGTLIALSVIGVIVLIAQANGKRKAELRVSNDNAEALKKDAEIDEHYSHTDIDTARNSMRDKVHKHNT